MSDTGRPGEPEPRSGATGPTHRPAATPQGVSVPGGGWAGAQGADAPATAPSPGTAADGTPSGGRPAWLVPVAAGAGVLVVAGVVIGVLVSRGGDEQAPTPAASTVVVPLPTPAAEPVARSATTAFASALPTTVLQYALVSSQEDAEWASAGALEAYTETLTDGGTATVTVRAGQYETAGEATAALQRLTAALPAAAPAAGTATAEETSDASVPALPATGDVMVAGAPVGTFTVVDAGDGTGIAVWQNGTAVFQLTAPLADVLDVYTAYGL